MGKQINIKRYQPSDKRQWDTFIRASKNGHFLFYRDYMEYHADRFEDHSLLIIQENGALVAVLPAHQKGGHFATHNGLTYGGFILSKEMKTPLMVTIFENVLTYLKEWNFEKFTYKTIPYIHHLLPAEEDRYALFLYKAILYRRDSLSVIYQTERPPYQERRIRNIKKALKADLSISLSSDLSAYWQLLSKVLEEQHGVKPVHTVQEIAYLASVFPEHIKLYCAFYEGTVVAGVLIYETTTVARCQYIAASSQGKMLGGLDLLFDYLINRVYVNKLFFDFGASTEKNGTYLNQGLIEQKEGFGARCVVHDHYEMYLKINI